MARCSSRRLRRLSLATSGREELERQFEQDRAALERGGNLGWHSEEQES